MSAISLIKSELIQSAEEVLNAQKAEIQVLREGNQQLKVYLMERKAQSAQREVLYDQEISAALEEIARQVRALEQLQFTPRLHSLAPLEARTKALLEKKLTPSPSIPHHAALSAKILALHEQCSELATNVGKVSGQALWITPVRAGNRAQLQPHNLFSDLGILFGGAVKARAVRQGQLPCHAPATPAENALFDQAREVLKQMETMQWQ